MKKTIHQVFHSSKFVAGFVIFCAILLTMIVYPLINPGDPLEIIGLGSFFEPGTYISLYDSIGTEASTLKLADADLNRLVQVLDQDERVAMVAWFDAAEVDVTGLDINDTDALLTLWNASYDSSIRPAGMTQAKRNYYQRLNDSLQSLTQGSEIIIASQNEEGVLEEQAVVTDTAYVNLSDVANVKTLPLGTDNFGRDTLKELVSACGTSIFIGLIAGAIATFIGLSLGLLAGYVGGFVDDFVMFITNLFTVIPGFVLLILISYSIGQESRGATTCAIVIGLTSWVWTARSVRSQVISLRNRDHVNLSKISGHSMLRIVLADILPYIASYVVMAFILQVSSGILAEAQLSLLGLGPKTTEIPTLGLMMNWAMMFSATTNGAWWAYFPVILTITLITFSLNLMNTGLDQVFNPTLRD